MSERSDAIAICKVVIKKKFGLNVPDSILGYAYDLTEKFAMDPAKRDLSPSELLKDPTIFNKTHIISDKMSKKYSNVS